MAASARMKEKKAAQELKDHDIKSKEVLKQKDKTSPRQDSSKIVSKPIAASSRDSRNMTASKTRSIPIM